MAFGKLKVDQLETSTQTLNIDDIPGSASPTFTGTVTIPTATADDNTTKAASTAYVQTELGDYATKAAPTFTGTVTVPTASADDNTTAAASTAYVQTELGDYLTTTAGAPKASPALTGTPTAPTAASSTNTTQIATTAFVQDAIPDNVTTWAIGTGAVATTNTDLDLAGTFAQTPRALGALDIDCSTGNYFTKTISGDSTFTVSNVPSGKSYVFTLELTHTSGVITWFANVKWPQDTAPSLSTGKTHLFIFSTDDGGTRWRAASLIDYVT